MLPGCLMFRLYFWLCYLSRIGCSRGVDVPVSGGVGVPISGFMVFLGWSLFVSHFGNVLVM